MRHAEGGEGRVLVVGVLRTQRRLNLDLGLSSGLTRSWRPTQGHVLRLSGRAESNQAKQIHPNKKKGKKKGKSVSKFKFDAGVDPKNKDPANSRRRRHQTRYLSDTPLSIIPPKL